MRKERGREMKITVLGCGRWGSFHAWYADHIGHDVMLWGRPGSAHLQQLKDTRENEYLKLPESVALTEDLPRAVSHADVIVISISSQQLRSFARELVKLPIAEKKFVLCMKGLEIGTGKRLSMVFDEETGAGARTAVWVGPGHVQDFLRGIPNCMVIAAKELPLTKELVSVFGSPLIRFYYGEDLLGTEIGAAAKNVIGIAAGMLDGAGFTSIKGALMARGTREVARLIKAAGGNEISAYGLCHLGDYEATLFSPWSHNRRFGEMYIKGEKFEKLAEGVMTSKAMVKLGEQLGVDLPITKAVYRILFENSSAKEELNALFTRSIKEEF